MAGATARKYQRRWSAGGGCRRHRCTDGIRRQNGITVLLVLLLMIVVMMIGTSAALLALQGEKAARGERDRHIAFQAAEDALADAEQDIQGATGSGSGDAGAGGSSAGSARSAMFSADAEPAFSDSCGGSGSGSGSGSGAGGGTSSASAGLLQRADGEDAPVWQTVDLSGVEDGGLCSVQYGTFTSAEMQTGQGFLPFKRPRYVIERMLCHLPGEDAAAGAAPHYCYRVTVIGFGAQPGTETVLQSVFRKDD